MSKHIKYTNEEINEALTNKLAYIDEDCELYESDEECKHTIKASQGGGIECMRCGGWFCY